MTLPSDHWQRALALMDTAVTLRPEQGDAWLDEIAAAEPRVAPLLRKLLSAHHRVETNDMLATLPRPDREARHQSNGEIGAQIGPFELIELLGRGGMGSVWRARYADGRLKRDVAVKLPATSDNPAALSSLRERFARERDFLAQLEHPNIARLYDTGFSDTGQPYLAMEYVAGEPIDTYCDTHRLTIKARLTLYLQVLDAVEFAHRQLVLHRDLKPGNVLVDGNGQARLLDFGVAKLLPEISTAANSATSVSTGTDLTEMAGAAITLAYAAPEQINSGRLSTATDVYALGVMLYRLLTGSAPYQPKRDTRGALEDAVLTANPANASTRFVSTNALEARQTTEVALRRTLAGDIDTILAKALKKNADERYPTVAALADDLRRHLAQQPINARPDSAWYRGSRFVARHRVAVAASLLGVTALLATTGVAVWQAQVATASAARANKEAKRANTAQKFLAGLFASADPEKSKTSTAFARQVLERGLATAERELADDAEAHGLVLQQIGEIYDRLGLPEESLAAQQRRLAVIATVRGVDPNTIADARLALGNALASSTIVARNVEAMPWFVLAHQRGVADGASPERIALALCSIADQHRNEKRLPEARRVAQEAVAFAERELPNPSKYLSIAYATSAAIARDAGEINEARDGFGKSIAMDLTGSGRGLLDSVSSYTMLAQLEHDAGNYLEAAKQAVAAIRAIEQSFGDVNINLAAARRIAVLAAERSGDLPLAQRYVNEFLAPELASDQPMRVATANMVAGRVLMSAGDFAQAAQSFDAATRVLDSHKLWRVRVNALRTELAIRQGQFSDAHQLIAETLKRQQVEFSVDHPELAVTFEWLAVAEARLSQYDASSENIAKSCNIRSNTRAANHPQRIRCEAYRTLLNRTATPMTKARDLRALLRSVATGRDDHITLIAAMQSEIRRLETESGATPTMQFPILD